MRVLFLGTTAVLVLGGCLALAAAIAAVVMDGSNPFAMMGAVIFLALAAAVGGGQYRGAFRRNDKVLAGVALVLLVLAGVVVFVVSATTLEAVATDSPLRKIQSLGWFYAIAVATIALCLGMAKVNWMWVRAGRPGEVPQDPQASRFSLRELLCWMCAAAVFFALAVLFVDRQPPRFAEGVTPDEAGLYLPNGASDVSVYRGGNGTTAFEFTVDEAGFLAWAEYWPVAEIHGSASIERYSYFTGGEGEATILFGLYYGWSEDDRGLYVAYDRENQRAYYFSHTR